MRVRQLVRVFGSLVGAILAIAMADHQALAQVAAAAEGRARIDIRQPPWSGVGKLQAVGGSLRVTCTGAIIGKRTILTAAHCLYNARTRHNFLPSSVHFLAGFAGQNYTIAAVGEELIVGLGFDPEKPSETRGSDWALVILDTEVGTRERLLPLSLDVPRPGTAAMIGGYGQDNPNILMADVSCRLLGYSVDSRGRRLIRHDCISTHGVSGAPVFIRLAEGWSVAGVNVAHSQIQAVGLATTLEGLRWRP